MKLFLCNDDQVQTLEVMHSTSPRRAGSSAALGVLFTPSGRFLHKQIQHLGLPNKERAPMSPLDVVDTSRGSLAKERPCGQRRGECSLAAFREFLSSPHYHRAPSRRPVVATVATLSHRLATWGLVLGLNP